MARTMKFLSYAAVGGFIAVLNLLFLWVLTALLGMHYLLSTLVSFIVLTPVAFLLQKLLTFRTPKARVRIEWPRYFATMGTSLAANLFLMYVLVSLLGVWYIGASVAVTVLFLVGNFLVNDRWSFALRR
jgi:putative flippase GtrA